MELQIDVSQENPEEEAGKAEKVQKKKNKSHACFILRPKKKKRREGRFSKRLIVLYVCMSSYIVFVLYRACWRFPFPFPFQKLPSMYETVDIYIL